MNVEVKQGQGGRWRWYVRDREDGLVAMSPVHGFSSRDLAVADAWSVVPPTWIRIFRCAICAVGGGILALILYGSFG